LPTPCISPAIDLDILVLYIIDLFRVVISVVLDLSFL